MLCYIRQEILNICAYILFIITQCQQSSQGNSAVSSSGVREHRNVEMGDSRRWNVTTDEKKGSLEDSCRLMNIMLYVLSGHRSGYLG